MTIKIYAIVRGQLESSFSKILVMHSDGTAMNKIKNSGFVAYNSKNNNPRIRPMVWG